MNILQQEDMVKGLPDDRLMQEAKSPTGQLPQFLLVSEVQRRTDMRKRFEAQQEKPEGTVADQILQGGIGSIQRPPEGQGSPPPNMPNPLPQGQGISPNPNQFPPPQPPNAEMAPQGGGYAAGGIVNMAGGGMLNFSQGARNYNLRRTPYRNDQMAYEDMLYGNGDPQITEGGWGDPWNSTVSFNPDGSIVDDAKDAVSAPDMSGIVPTALSADAYSGAFENTRIPTGNTEIPDVNVPYVSSDSFNSAKPETNAGIVDLGIKALPADMQSLNQETTSSDQEKSDQLRKYLGMLNPEGAWDALKSGAKGLSDMSEEVYNTYNVTGLRPGFEGSNGIIDVAANKSPEVAAALQEDSNYDPDYTVMSDEDFARDVAAETKVLGTDTSMDEQRANAEGAVIKGLKSANTASRLDKLLEQQRNSAWSNAIIQLGAGIAGGDVSGGLSRAGTAMASGQAQANDTTRYQSGLEQRQLEHSENLAQRQSEVESGYGSRGGDPAEMRTLKWVMGLPEEQRKIVMAYQGREMPDNLATEAVLEMNKERIKMSMEPMTIAEMRTTKNELLQGLWGQGESTIPQSALDALKANPAMRDQFIAKYGKVPTGY